MSGPDLLPRASLVALCTLHALVLAAAAYFLPWPSFTVFAVLAGLTAAGHVVTATLALVGSRHRGMSWRLTSLLSLGLLGYFTYAAIGSGLYVNLLYQGVGTAIFAAAIAAWCVGVLFLLPLSLWGIAKTGGLFRRRRGAPRAVGAGTAIVGGVVILAFAAATEASTARGRSHLDATAPQLDDLVTLEMATLPVLAAAAPASAPSLFVSTPVDCPTRPHATDDVTVFVTYLAADLTATSDKEDKAEKGRKADKGGKAVDEGPALVARTACLSHPDEAGALRAARDHLQANQATGDAVIDVVISSRELPDAGPLLGPVVLKPGTEGTCDGARCLLPWQLFGLDAFTEAANVSALQAELGVTADALRKRLGVELGKGFVGLDAITTRTYFVRGSDRSTTRYEHLRAGPRRLDPETVDEALEDAAGFIVSSQIKDGRYRYTVQPFDGAVSFSNFSVPRQAGTTLALCDAANHSSKAKASAKSSLKFLVSLLQTKGELGGIIYPRGKKVDAPLGSTALTLIALLSCRDLVGHDFDETITKMLNTLLLMQRDDGGFMPAWSPATGAPIPGRDPLYAAGQAVFALVLWEGAEGEGLPRPAGLRAAVDKAMAYYAGPYWDIPLRDFFYLEENWHCLAARAALTHHRRDDYERFCTDYMTMKMRFIQSPTSGADEHHVGAYAFGHVFPPHHAASAGFSEGLAASIEIKRARKEATAKEEQVLRWSLAYLLRHQWRTDNCFMCTKKIRIVGGFSENVASPIVRIDFVQHAMSGILHGGRALGLVPPRQARGQG